RECLLLTHIHLTRSPPHPSHPPPSPLFPYTTLFRSWHNTEASITQLFATESIRILRKQGAPIEVQGQTLNLIGVDFETRVHFHIDRKSTRLNSITVASRMPSSA